MSGLSDVAVLSHLWCMGKTHRSELTDRPETGTTEPRFLEWDDDSALYESRGYALDLALDEFEIACANIDPDADEVTWRRSIARVRRAEAALDAAISARDEIDAPAIGRRS